MTPATVPSFDVTVIPIETYQYFERLPGLVDDANAIASIFAEIGALTLGPCEIVDLDEATARKRLHAWASRDTPSSVLIWLGHGETDDRTSCLACYDTRDPIVDNGLVPATLENYLRVDWEHRQPTTSAWTIVIFEACGAGKFVDKLSSLLSPYGMDRVCLISATGSGASYLGGLRQVLESALRRLTVNDVVITTRGLVDEIEDGLPLGHRVIRGSLGKTALSQRITGAAICATFDLRAELQSLLEQVPPDERNHFFPKARSTELTESGFHFIGREQEMSTLYGWLSTCTNGMLVVSGGPGSGKSALLGNLVLQTSLRWRALMDNASWRRGPHPPSEAGGVDAAIHLTGLATADLVSKIADAAELTMPSRGATWSENDTDALVSGLASRRFTLLVDGLDEAVDPIAIASTVLRRLSELPRVRVVVGTRPSVAYAADSSDSINLIDALSAGSAEQIHLNNDQNAVAEYVRDRLTNSSVSATNVEKVVTALTTRLSGTEFLYARLAIHEILAQPSLTDESGLAALHSGDHRSLFSIAVDRLVATTPHALALLRVLAIARGRGIQRSERVWARAATFLGDGSTVTEADIDLLLERAAPYIMIDAEYGVTVYRMAHQTYRSVLLPEGGHG